MSQFLHRTILDMRTGRETWRVFATLGTAAFTVAVALKLI